MKKTRWPSKSRRRTKGVNAVVSVVATEAKAAAGTVVKAAGIVVVGVKAAVAVKAETDRADDVVPRAGAAPKHRTPIG